MPFDRVVGSELYVPVVPEVVQVQDRVLHDVVHVQAKASTAGKSTLASISPRAVKMAKVILVISSNSWFLLKILFSN